MFLYTVFLMGQLDLNSVGPPHLCLVTCLQPLLVATPLLKKINHWSEDKGLGFLFK